MCGVLEKKESWNGDGCKDASAPGGQGVKGKVLGEDGERRALGTHRCTRHNLDLGGQETRFDHK